LRRYADAGNAFMKAIELSPEDPDLRTNYGLCLQKAGHAEEAKKAFAEAERLRAAQKKAAGGAAN